MTLECLGFRNLYPCGEGAGYAGGIVSAAVDGLKVGKAIILKSNAPITSSSDREKRQIREVTNRQVSGEA